MIFTVLLSRFSQSRANFTRMFVFWLEKPDLIGFCLARSSYLQYIIIYIFSYALGLERRLERLRSVSRSFHP